MLLAVQGSDTWLRAVMAEGSRSFVRMVATG
jgi:hypothetical protein